MALNLQQIRDYARLSLDVEEDDLPNTLLDMYAREGSKRIERAEPRWPFYEASFALTIPASSTSVEKVAISEELDQIKSIIFVSGAYPPLAWIGFDVHQELLKQSATTSSRPTYFSEFGQKVHFFPQSDTSYDVTVNGYRKAADWVATGAGGTPDMPDELHNTIAMWVLARSYAQQEDPELAALYERQFSDELNEFRRRLIVTPMHQPLILNGGNIPGGNRLLAPPRYDWEPGI